MVVPIKRRSEPNRPPSLIVPAQQGRARNLLFFPSKFDRLFQDFRFHRLLPSMRCSWAI
jgi:hypothetical protein